MPRTKITKNAKRKQDADSREEKIRIFKLKMDSVMMSLDDMEVRYKTIVNNQLKFIESQLPTKLREMKMPVFLELLHQLDNFKHIFKNPARPAHARRKRRSRSACDSKKELATASATPRCSRSKLHTPLATHKKSLSADRMSRQKHQSEAQPVAFLRWPKPGELALSKFGSPIVAQVQPTNFANLNIPIRNGVLSLLPMKLVEVEPELLKNLDENTLNQMCTLRDNLGLLVEAARIVKLPSKLN